MSSHHEVELRYRPSLLMNIRATGAVRACIKWVRRIRRWARWAVPIGVVAAFSGHALLAVYLFALVFIVEPAFWGSVILQGATTWWGARHAHGEQRLELGPAGMRTTGPLMRGDIGWEAVTAVHERRRFIVVMLRHGKGFAIPKRGRMDHVENDEALAWLRERQGWPSLHGRDPGEVPLEQADDEILVAFRPTRAMVARALQAVTWNSPVGVGSVIFFGAVWVAVGLRPLLGFIGAPGLATLPGLISALFIAGMFVLLVVGGGWWQARRLVTGDPEERNEQQIGISPSGIRARGPVSVATLDWGSVRRSVESGRFFLIFISHSAALYIPKEACTDDQIREIRALLGERRALTAAGVRGEAS